MGGRQEGDIRIDELIRGKLKNYPPVILAFYQQMLADGKSYATAKLYIDTIISFVEYMYAGAYPEDFYTRINSKNIQSYLDSVSDKFTDRKSGEASNAARAQKWSTLNSFFRFLTPRYIAENPVSQIPRPKLHRVKEMIFLSMEELNQIMSTARFSARPMVVNRDLSILMLGFYRGLNVSSIQNLDLDNLDLENNRIWISTKDGFEEVSLTKQIAEQIRLWLVDRENYYGHPSTNAVFVSQLKGRLSADAIHRITTRYAAGINKQISPQVMKNTCIVNLYKQTGDINLCAKYLKHKSVSTTQRYIDQLMGSETGSIEAALTIMDDLILPQYYEEAQEECDQTLAFSAKCKLLRSIRKEIAELNGIDFPMPECANDNVCTGRCSLMATEIQYLNAELNRKAQSGISLRVADITMDSMVEGYYGLLSVARNPVEGEQLSLF
jgi:integrase/recombinase XerD